MQPELEITMPQPLSNASICPGKPAVAPRRFLGRLRKTNLTASAIATALLVFSSTAFAQQAGDLKATWRATSRLGYGPSADTAQAALADPKAWAKSQLNLAWAASQQAAAIPADLSRFNQPVNTLVRDFHAEREARKVLRVDTTPNSAADQTGPLGFSREMQQTAVAWRLMACSDPALENPLLARMTEFWFNHLNVFSGKAIVRPFVGHYVVNAIRPHSLGKFEDLLLASARHPAMLFYLDQAQSNVRGLNENYARELMELHTLGVNAGYSQNDVHELARILTGWTVPLQQGEGFRFVDRLHDKGSKTLLGRTFSAAGEREGEDALRMLARHPATGRRIAKRLATTFVSDQPTAALVDMLAATFSQTQGDIRALMQALIDSPEFWKEQNTLFKTPLDFACSALVAAGGAKERREIQLTLGFLTQAGQPLHGWQTPDGYPTDEATWLAPEALTRRADFALALGGRMADPVYLSPFLNPSARARITTEPAPSRAGLMLAGPDFMRK